jgi:hypothetical protein
MSELKFNFTLEVSHTGRPRLASPPLLTGDGPENSTGTPAPTRVPAKDLRPRSHIHEGVSFCSA